MTALLCLAAAMAAGLLFTRIVKPIGLPNVTAYLVAGLLIGPSVSNIVTEEIASGFDVIVTLALGFIAFSIGVEFKFSHLKEIGGKVLVITLFQALAAVVCVFVTLLLFGFDLPIVFTLSAIATATAPAATLLVIRQYKAHGPVTETLLPVVALDDAIGLIIFSVFMSISKSIAGGEGIRVGQMILEPLREIGLSIVAGTVIGLILTLCIRFFKSRANRLSLMITAVVAGVALAERFGLSSLLVCMLIGAIFINMREDAEYIIEGCDRWTPPLFLLFFVVSGADLDLSILPSVGLVGVLYIIARSIGKYSGAAAGAAIVKAEPNVRKYLGFTLLPQAGVAIGMAQIAAAGLPSELGAQIRAVVLCATIVYEIIGPVVTKISLLKNSSARLYESSLDSSVSGPPSGTWQLMMISPFFRKTPSFSLT